MRQFLKTFLTLGVLTITALIVTTGCSCQKKNPGNNNSGGNSGNGGSTQQPDPPAIVITNIDSSIAQLNGDTIELKASGFPTAVANTDADANINSLSSAPNGSLKRAFDVIITGGFLGAATGGLISISTGNKLNANDFSIGSVRDSFIDYSSFRQKEGTISLRATDVSAANGYANSGWNIYGVFMNNTAPTDAASAAANASPFSFTPITGANETRPFIFCRTTISTITDSLTYFPNNNGTRVEDGTVLTGGHKASCYVGSFITAFTGANANAWLNTPASNTFKKKFDFAVIGIRTDGKTIAQIGLPGTNKAMAFWDGLVSTEITALTAANPSAFKKFSATIVP